MQAKDILNANIQFAKSAIENGDYERAIMYLRISAINYLELAKNAIRQDRQDYYDKAKSLLDTIEVLEKKTPTLKQKGDVDKSVADSFALFGESFEKSTSHEVVKNDELNPIQSQSLKRESDVVGAAIRPQTLADYIGQPSAVLAVKDSIKSAKLRNTALQHVLVYGSHGLGKTTFARIIANEMGANFIEINVSKLTPKELINVLSKLNEKDIVFIDEIHNLPQETAESVLYSAMEDFQVCYVEKVGKDIKTTTIKLPSFTLIGATTEAGKLPKPLIARAQIQCRLVPYTDEVLTNIVQSSFSKLGMKINESEALTIAKRCRQNPRIANRHVSRIADKAICYYAEQNGNVKNGSLNSIDAIKSLNILVSKNVVMQYFEENGIDILGLEEGDREMLSILINDFNGGPTSLDTLARAMGESVNVVFEKYEDYLLKMGMIKIASNGRIATKRAYEHLGIAYNKDDDDGGSGDDGGVVNLDIDKTEIDGNDKQIETTEFAETEKVDGGQD